MLLLLQQKLRHLLSRIVHAILRFVFIRHEIGRHISLNHWLAHFGYPRNQLCLVHFGLEFKLFRNDNTLQTLNWKNLHHWAAHLGRWWVWLCLWCCRNANAHRPSVNWRARAEAAASARSCLHSTRSSPFSHSFLST